METININDIEIVRNIRPDTSDVAELMDSIKQNGLLEPIGVSKDGKKYILLYGHRRFEALKKLGRTTLEVNKEILINTDKKDIVDLLILNTVENIQREDISPISLGAIANELKSIHEMSLSEIAARLSKPKATIGTAIKLFLNIPINHRKDAIYVNKQSLKKGKLSATVLEKITRIENLTTSDKDFAMTYAKREELTAEDIATVRTLVQGGMGIKEALEKCKEYRTIYVILAVKRSIATEVQKKYGLSISTIMKKQLTQGGIDLPNNLFFKKGK